MRSFRVLIITVMILAASVMCVLAENYNEVESNNTVGSADPISVETGNSYSGSLGSYDSKNPDWFRFTIYRGSAITFNVTAWSSGNSRFYVEFYKPSDFNEPFAGFFAKYNNNLGYHYKNQKMYLAAGTYYVKLSSGNYSFSSYTISFPDTVGYEDFVEPNDTIPSATTCVINSQYTGIINSGGEPTDADFFKVSVSNAGNYNISLRNVNVSNEDGYEKHLYLEAMDAEGNSLSILNGESMIFAENGSTVKTTISLPAGTTYLKIYSGSFVYVAYAGQYSFSITKPNTAPASTIYPGTVSRVSKPGKVKGLKLTKSGKRIIKMKWDRVKGAKGYKIYRSTSKYGKYKCIKTIKSGSTTKYVNKKLKKGKRYYYKVYAYKKVHGTVYKGKASAIKSKKI